MGVADCPLLTWSMWPLANGLLVIIVKRALSNVFYIFSNIEQNKFAKTYKASRFSPKIDIFILKSHNTYNQYWKIHNQRLKLLKTKLILHYYKCSLCWLFYENNNTAWIIKLVATADPLFHVIKSRENLDQAAARWLKPELGWKDKTATDLTKYFYYHLRSRLVLLVSEGAVCDCPRVDEK